MLSTAWTDDRVGRLKQLWTDGLSAREIARALGGVTRNAVIGKLHRLGLLGSRGPVSAKPRRRPARTAPVARRRLAPKIPRTSRETAPALDWPGEVAGVEALGPHHCRWPIGDPRDDGFSFCGRRAEAGPYCPAHCAVAFVRDGARAVDTVRAA
jgi:GcrA cell cycle regulator